MSSGQGGVSGGAPSGGVASVRGGQQVKVGDHVHVCCTVEEIGENGNLVVKCDDNKTICVCPADCCEKH